MFLGELSCLVAFHSLVLYRKCRRDPMDVGPQKFSPFIFLPASLCDMCGTSIMYIGLNLTFASSFQMLRGTVGLSTKEDLFLCRICFMWNHCNVHLGKVSPDVHYSDFTWATLFIRSSATPLFIQQFVQKTAKLRITIPFCGEPHLSGIRGGFPHKGPVMRGIFRCFDVIMRQGEENNAWEIHRTFECVHCYFINIHRWNSPQFGSIQQTQCIYCNMIGIIPFLCDKNATNMVCVYRNSACYRGFNLCASISGAVMIFTALLSVIFLRRVIQNYMWIGMGIVFVGLVTVGVSDMVFGSEDKSDINGIISGKIQRANLWYESS